MEPEQCAAKQLVDHCRNQKRKQYIWRQIKIKAQQSNCDTVKAVLRGKFIMIQAYLRKQENLKQPNFIPKGI